MRAVPRENGAVEPGRKGQRPEQSKEPERREMSGLLGACDRGPNQTAPAELRGAGRGERREAASA